MNHVSLRERTSEHNRPHKFTEPDHYHLDDDEYSKWIGDDMLYYDEFDEQGNRTIVIPKEADSLNFAAEAKKLIKAIVNTEKDFINLKSIERSPRNILNMRALHRFNLMQNFFALSHNDYEISEHEKLIERALARHPVQPWMFTGSPFLIFPELKKPIGEIYNSIICDIRAEAISPTFKKKVADRIYKCVLNARGTKSMVSNIFASRKRLLCLRLDLHIRNHCLTGMSPAKVKALLAKFLTGIRGRANLSKSRLAYAIRMEFGRYRKYHFHCFFFYDGDVRRNASYVTDLLGDYWEEITEGTGYFINCNRHPDPFKRFGIGMIKHDDTDKRAKLIRGIEYICKRDEYLRVLAKGRTFFKSAVGKTNIFKGRKYDWPKKTKTAYSVNPDC